MNILPTVDPRHLRPQTIIRSIQLLLLSFVVGSINAYFVFPALMEQLRASGLGEDAIPSNTVLWVGLLVGMVLNAVLLSFVWRGSNVARWILALFTAYGLFSGLGALEQYKSIGMSALAAGVVAHLLAVAAVVVLFLPISSAWFKAVAARKSAQKQAAAV